MMTKQTVALLTITLLVLGFGARAIQAQTKSLAPISAWVLNTDGRKGSSTNATINAVVSQIPSDVRQVSYSDSNVYIKTEGIPTYPVGPFGDGNPSIPTARNHTFRITRNPQPATGTHTSAPLGMIGVHVNGVPFYSALDARSYRNQNIWHQNALFFELSGLDAGPGHPSPDMQMTNGILGGTYHHHSLPTSLLKQIGAMSATQHSPIIGFAFDGYPIYGPYGYANPNGTGSITRIRSSYQKRNITRRTSLPDGTQLTTNQYGPDVSAQFPLGAYAEDYEFISGSGELDAYNGRFAVTPEYPNGTYAYFATIEADGTNAYPYLIGTQYYGVVTNDNNRQTVSIPTTGLSTVAMDIATVNAASYVKDALAAGAIASLFGTSFSTTMANASGTTLPTTLAGVALQLTDSTGTARDCPLFYVSPTQINFFIPEQVATGAAILKVNKADGTASSTVLTINAVAPSLFAADASGKGLAAAIIQRVKANGIQSYEPVVRFDSAQNQLVAVPVDFGAASDQLYLVLFGTGIRARSAVENVKVVVGVGAQEVLYAGDQREFVGLDQINLRLDRSLSGLGETSISVTIDGKAANQVKVLFR
ncbi:MAG: YHYH protein [Acidobacteria bacterium]|nr:YHYH protein [Acidobacteriota bacterium]